MDLKKIWSDPVWSKVISAGVIALLGWLTYRLRLWSALWRAIVAAWTFLGSTSPVPHWVLIAGAVVVVAAVVHIFSAVFSGQDQAATPGWRQYTTDVFYGLRWRWRFDGSRIDGLSPFCPACGYALVPEDWGMSLRFRCDKCPREYTAEAPLRSLLSKVERLAYQKLSSGEWKSVVDAASARRNNF